MNINELIDHTYLKAFGTRKEIDLFLQQAREYHFQSICVNPIYVRYCHEALAGTGIHVGTVVGFPLGANTTETKVFETLNAVKNGADEIDMVINIGELKSGNYDYVRTEIDAVVKAAGGRIVKVVIETCYLSDAEIVAASELIAKTDATYIKTSTGYGSEGATKAAVQLMKKHGGGKQIMASGGIRTRMDFERMLDAGANRIGTSNGDQIVKNESRSGY